MKLIGESTKLKFAALCIGDNFTMGPDDAVKAADFIRCDEILGVHFDTFPPIKIDHAAAKEKFKAAGKTAFAAARRDARFLIAQLFGSTMWMSMPGAWCMKNSRTFGRVNCHQCRSVVPSTTRLTSFSRQYFSSASQTSSFSSTVTLPPSSVASWTFCMNCRCKSDGIRIGSSFLRRT